MSSIRTTFATLFLTSTLLAQDSSLPISTDLQERKTNQKETSFGGYSNSSECRSPYNKCEFPYFSDMWPCAAIYGSVETGYKEFRTPGFNYGTISSNGSTNFQPFDFYSKKNEHPDGPYVSAILGFELPNCWDLCFLGCHSFLEFGFSYWRAQELNSHEDFTVVSGTLAFPSLTDPTGLVEGFGPGTVIGNYFNRDFEYIDADIYLRTVFDYCFCDHNFLIEPFIGAQFNKFTQSYGADSTGTLASVTLGLGLHEHLRTNYYDFGGGIKFDTPLTCCLNFEMTAGGYASYGRSHLHARQIFSLQEAQLFQQELELTQNKWSGKFKGSAGLGWRCCHALFSLVGNYEYWGYMPQINNPFSPLAVDVEGSQPTHLTNSHSHNWSVGLRITFPILSRV